MEKSPNKTNVEEIQPIFIAKPKTEEKWVCFQINLHKS